MWLSEDIIKFLDISDYTRVYCYFSTIYNTLNNNIICYMQEKKTIKMNILY